MLGVCPVRPLFFLFCFYKKYDAGGVVDLEGTLNRFGDGAAAIVVEDVEFTGNQREVGEGRGVYLAVVIDAKRGVAVACASGNQDREGIIGDFYRARVADGVAAVAAGQLPQVRRRGCCKAVVRVGFAFVNEPVTTDAAGCFEAAAQGLLTDGDGAAAGAATGATTALAATAAPAQLMDTSSPVILPTLSAKSTS